MRGPVAIVGVGRTPVGRLAGVSAEGLYQMAASRAAADAGVALGDIDGVITANSRTRPVQSHAESLAEALGMAPRFTLTLGTGGATTLKSIALADRVIRAGLARRVLVAAADDLASGLRGGAVGSLAETGYREFERPYLPFAPATFALMARRHMHDHGTTGEDLASVAVTMRAHAALTPEAQQRDRITVEDVLASPLVADPLHRLDCSLISDGGAAIVIAGEDDAGAAARPVWIRAFGEGHASMLVAQDDLARREACRRAAAAAFDGSGVHRDDVDLALIYDPFTIELIASLEALGFCGDGDVAAFVRSGGISLNGRLPVNPHGGLLSYAHPGRSGAILHVAEAVRQLRHEVEPARQVRNASLAVLSAEGAMLSEHAVLLLGTDRP